MKIEDVKPGMKVKIVVEPNKGQYGYGEVGRILTVRSVNHSGNWVFCEEFHGGAIAAGLVEPFAFTKEDLRTGMRVQYKDGGIRVVAGDRLLNKQATLGNLLTSYREDLTNVESLGIDIIRVWAAPEECEDFFNFEKTGPLLFERQEKTAEELKKEILSAKMDDIKKQLSSLQEEYNKL